MRNAATSAEVGASRHSTDLGLWHLVPWLKNLPSLIRARL